jgi:prepilin-type N-terminal cleavage/methylation domain-containing protein
MEGPKSLKATRYKSNSKVKMKNEKLKNLDGRLRCNLKFCNLQFAICNSRRGGFTPLERKFPFWGRAKKYIARPVTKNISNEPNFLTGFTLLEIMIALAIVGVAIIAILHTVNYHADVAYEHTITTRMLLMAREKIAEMEINPKNDKGIFPETDFSYETIITDIKDPQQTEYKGIVELKAIVRGHDKEIELSELVIKK